MFQSMLDDLPPTPEAAGRPVQKETSTKPAIDSVAVTKPPKQPSRGNLKQPSVRQSTEVIEVPNHEPSAIPTTSKSSAQPVSTVPSAKHNKPTLAASTTPPISPDNLSPASSMDQQSNVLNPGLDAELVQPKKTRPQPDSTSDKAKAEASKRSNATTTAPVPHHMRTQTTPVRPTYGAGRAQHKYSPAVPSPLSRVVRVVESPPSSPESKAQAQRAQRPPVIAEEDEEDEVKDEAGNGVPGTQQDEQPTDTSDDDAIPEVEPRPGSLSPLSRILQMGLSPAIAPTLAVSSFPGLLGTGPKLGGNPQPLTKGLGLGLGNKVATGFGGFGSMPGGFQLGTAITGRVQTSAASKGAGGTRQVAKTVKTATTVKTIKPSAAVTKQKQPKPPKVVFGENRRTSESTSSSGSSESAGPSGSGSGRSSAASNKPSGGTSNPRNAVTAGGMVGKENEAKRRAAATVTAATGKATSKKLAAPTTAKQPPKAPVVAGMSRRPGAVPSAASKPTAGKGWKG